MSWIPRHPALQRPLSATPKEFSGVRAYGLSFTWLSNFHGRIDSEIFLAMGLRSRGLRNPFNLSKYSGVRTSKNLLYQALSADHSRAMYDVCKRLATVPGRCCSHYTRDSFWHRHQNLSSIAWRQSSSSHKTMTRQWVRLGYCYFRSILCLSHYAYTKCFCRVMKKISNEIYQGARKP